VSVVTTGCGLADAPSSDVRCPILGSRGLRLRAERAFAVASRSSWRSTRTVPSIMVTLICTAVEADVESGTDGDQSPVETSTTKGGGGPSLFEDSLASMRRMVRSLRVKATLALFGCQG